MTAEVEIYEPHSPSSPTCISKITETNNPASTSISTEEPTHVPPISPADKESSLLCTESDLSSENAVPGSLLTTQALLSLERICAAFSSDSLGSLEMTDEGANCGDDSQSDLLFTNERNSNVVPPASLTNLSHSRKAVLTLDCSVTSESSFKEDVNLVVDEGSQASGPLPRPPTPIVKSSTWASSTPRRRRSATSTASSSSSSISILASVHSKKPFQSKGSPTFARTPILASSKPSSKYPTNKLAKSVKDTFYKAVPPLQNQNNRPQQPLLPSRVKVSIFPKTLDQIPASPGSPPSVLCKPRSHTISAVSPLPATLLTPHTAKTISSSAKRRSNTLDSYLQVPSKNAKSPTRTKPVSFEVDDIVPTAAFMRRPDMKTTSVNTSKMTSSAASAVPLTPDWCPSLPSSVLSPTQYRNMLRNGDNMGVR